MTNLKHFDTRLNQWLHTDGDRHNLDSILTEELNNTLLEFFLPNQSLSLGQMDQHTTEEDLKNHPENHVLLFSSTSRLLYGPQDCLEVVQKLCPDHKDRGAYGSIFLGSCKNKIYEKLNILVVDDTTGENGGILVNNNAYCLTGDSYGQISTQLYEQLTQRKKGSKEPYRVIQHRFGWRDSDGEDQNYRFGKGTLRPYNFNKLEYKNSSNQPNIDLILPLSSFKGTDKDNPKGATKPQIQPGLYRQTVWLGEKSSSQQGKTAISQLIASFPQGIKDFIEELEVQAQNLAQIQSDPRKVAELYCQKYEKLKALNQQEQISLEKTVAELVGSDQLPALIDLSNESEQNENIEDDNQSNSKEELFIYTLIKTDLQNHCQLLETEKIKNVLSAFVQRQWLDIAIGRTITFDRGMIIPSKALKNGEICVPWFKEEEEILNFRSPFLNSNGLCVSVNKYVEDYLDPDGKPLEGIIAVNDEDHKRIQNRIKTLNSQGIQTIEIDPPETESERQARDFDGDCIGVKLASNYPNLTAECKYRNLKENIYAPTVKLKKKSFYREDGTQPEFENIAIFMSDKMCVGIINNHLTMLQALESEIGILKLYGTPQQKSEYIETVANHYKTIISKNSDGLTVIPEEYNKKILAFLALASAKNKTSQNIEQAMEINRSFYRNLIEVACFQNQIAVDMFKSARSPDMNLIDENKKYLYRDVSYIKDKKRATIYLKNTLIPDGCSPVELLIAQTNKYFQNSQLESRPIIQFQDLFKDVTFTNQQKLAAIVANEEFNKIFNEATNLNQRCIVEEGPYAIIKTNNSIYFEITNLTRYKHPLIWEAQTLNIRLKEIPKEKRSIEQPHKLLAVAQINNELEKGQPKYRYLGTVSQQSVINYDLKDGMTTNNASLIEIRPELKQNQTKLLFKKAVNLAQEFYNSIPEPERLSVAAAVWNISATREEHLDNKISRNSQGKDHEEKYQQYKVSNFIFSAFPQEIISRLSQLQFTKLKLVNLDTNKVQKINCSSEAPYSLEIKQRLEENRKVVSVNYNDTERIEFLLEQKSGELPIGTKAQSTLSLGNSYSATAIINEPNQPPIAFNIQEVSKFSFSNSIFEGKQALIVIDKVNVPDKTVKVKINNQILGELDIESIKELEEKNCLINNSSLAIKLKYIVENKNAFIIGELPNQNLLKINKINFYDFKNQSFEKNSVIKITFEVQHTKMRDAVLLDGKLLGILRFQKDKEALKQLGIIKNGKAGKVNCLLHSNYSHAFVSIDPTSIQYPETWTKNNEYNVQPTVITEANKYFLQKITERPSVLFSSQEDKVFGLVGLSVDISKTNIVEKWLQSREIAYTSVPSELAKHKGLSTYYLTTTTITSQDWQGLVERFGLPLDSSGSNSSYSQYLQSLPNRQVAIKLTTLEDKFSPFLPSLLAHEDYEWEVSSGTFFEQPTTRIVVDKRKADTVINYFTRQGIAVHQATDSHDIEIEVQLGYSVFRIPNKDIPLSVQNNLQQKLGAPLEANRDGNYYQKLAQIQEQKLADKLINSNFQSKAAVSNFNETSINPLKQVTLLNPAVAQHATKDIAMAEVATQFIGKTAAQPGTPSSTCNYEQAWSDRANTGNYSTKDTIMVSGSGPWQGVTFEQIKQKFNTDYVPLLEKAIAARSNFVVGNAAGTDRLVQQYLQERGYKLEQTQDGYVRASGNQISSPSQISSTQKLNLAITAKNILINKKQTYIELEGYHIKQSGNLLTIAAKDGRAEILRLHGSEIIFEQLAVKDVSCFQEFQQNLEHTSLYKEQEHSNNQAVELIV